MDYKFNSEKIRQILSDKNTDISGIEKHLIQEGLKQISFGSGPIEIPVIGTSYSIRTITPSLENFLLELGIIDKFGEEGDCEDDLESIYDGDEGIEEESFLDWDYKGHKNNVNFFGTQKDWNQTLVTRINQLNSRFLKENKERYKPNYRLTDVRWRN